MVHTSGAVMPSLLSPKRWPPRPLHGFAMRRAGLGPRALLAQVLQGSYGLASSEHASDRSPSVNNKFIARHPFALQAIGFDPDRLPPCRVVSCLHTRVTVSRRIFASALPTDTPLHRHQSVKKDARAGNNPSRKDVLLETELSIGTM